MLRPRPDGPGRGWLPDGSRMTGPNVSSGKKADRLPARAAEHNVTVPGTDGHEQVSETCTIITTVLEHRTAPRMLSGTHTPPGGAPPRPRSDSPWISIADGLYRMEHLDNPSKLIVQIGSDREQCVMPVDQVGRVNLTPERGSRQRLRERRLSSLMGAAGEVVCRGPPARVRPHTGSLP